MTSTHSNPSSTTVDSVGDHLRWASMREVIGEKRMGNQLEKLKYGVRYYLSMSDVSVCETNRGT